MIRLSLKQFALASGATAKWVLNARPRLGQSLEYTERDARWLRLARALNRDVGIPLRTAAALARRVLVGSSAEDPSSEQAPGGGAPTQVTLADRTAADRTAADRTAANCADTSASASGSRRRSTRKPAVGSTSTRTANSGRSCSRNCRTVAEYKGAECKGTKRKGAEREGAECKGTSHE